MNGAHDLGGVHGFGSVDTEPNEPVFHAEWERRVFALTRAMGATGEWNLDAVRFAREDRQPVEYLAMSYYERWLAGLERLLTERGLVGPDELAAGRSLRPGRALPRILGVAEVAATLGRGSQTSREATRPARFAPGDRVRAENIHPSGHTRLPRYVRGHAGTVVRAHGAHVFPDSNAHGRGEDPQWLYTVCFDGRELWGAEADPTLTVSVDAFEPYLEPAP
jgi:nitrile hydratase